MHLEHTACACYIHQVQESDQQLKSAVERLQGDCKAAAAGITRLEASLSAIRSDVAGWVGSSAAMAQQQLDLEGSMHKLERRVEGGEAAALEAAAQAQQRHLDLQVGCS